MEVDEQRELFMRKNKPVPPPNIYSRAEQLRSVLAFTTDANLESKSAGPYLNHYYHSAGYPVLGASGAAPDGIFQCWTEEKIPQDPRTILPTVEPKILEIPILRFLLSWDLISHMPTYLPRNANTVKQPAIGVSVKFLDVFCKYLADRDDLTGSQVQRMISHPSTMENCCRLADLVRPPHTGEPHLYLCHPWDQPFSKVIDAVKKDALVQAAVADAFDPEAELSKLYVWVDVLCMNSHLAGGLPEQLRMLHELAGLPRHEGDLMPSFTVPWPKSQKI